MSLLASAAGSRAAAKQIVVSLPSLARSTGGGCNAPGISRTVAQPGMLLRPRSVNTTTTYNTNSTSRTALGRRRRRPLSTTSTTQQQPPHFHATAQRVAAGHRPTLMTLRSLPRHKGVSSSSRATSTRPTSRRGGGGSRRQKATLSPSPELLQQASQQTMRSNRTSLLARLEAFLRKPRTLPIPRWITPRHYTITLSEVLGHSSFLLVAISYAVDDFLMLRCIAVAGSTAMLFFAYWHPHGRPLWLPFKWNILFIILNSYRIGKVFMDEYFADMLPQELIALRDHNFYLMCKKDFARVVRLGAIRQHKKGDLIVAQGENNRYVRMVLGGELRVLRNGKLTYILEEANFVSESGLHAGLLLPGRVESCCTVVAGSDEVRVLVWDRTELVDLMERDPGVRRALQAAISWDIVRKLKYQRTLLASGEIDDPEEWTERRNEQTQHRYTAILHSVLLHPKFLKNSRKQLDKYRMVHHIDDHHHELALKACGWTLDEFEAGVREGRDEDDEEEHYEDIYRRDWRWYVHDAYMRIFG